VTGVGGGRRRPIGDALGGLVAVWARRPVSQPPEVQLQAVVGRLHPGRRQPVRLHRRRLQPW
jgi:hypothetical protein